MAQALPYGIFSVPGWPVTHQVSAAPREGDAGEAAPLDAAAAERGLEDASGTLEDATAMRDRVEEPSAALNSSIRGRRAHRQGIRGRIPVAGGLQSSHRSHMEEQVNRRRVQCGCKARSRRRWLRVAVLGTKRRESLATLLRGAEREKCGAGEVRRGEGKHS